MLGAISSFDNYANLTVRVNRIPLFPKEPTVTRVLSLVEVLDLRVLESENGSQAAVVRGCDVYDEETYQQGDHDLLPPGQARAQRTELVPLDQAHHRRYSLRGWRTMARVILVLEERKTDIYFAGIVSLTALVVFRNGVNVNERGLSNEYYYWGEIGTMSDDQKQTNWKPKPSQIIHEITIRCTKR